MIEPIHFSVVIPVFNEAASLPELIRRCVRACDSIGCTYELILVDDGSQDASRELIESAVEDHSGLVIGVMLNRNYGQHAAILAGFAEARGAWIATLDADLQNPPEELPRLLARGEEGYDVVGSLRRDRRDPLFRRFASKLVNFAARKATGIAMSDYGCMLRLYRRGVIEAVLRCHEHSTFIPVLANSFARRTTEIEVEHAERKAGSSKYSLWKLIQLQFDLLTGMTTFPLRLLSLIGGAISIFGVGFGALLLALRLIYGPAWAVDGVFTLFALLFTFVGLQFVGMGLLGEYIGRIYHDVRARPRALVERILGRDEAGSSSEPTSVQRLRLRAVDEAIETDPEEEFAFFELQSVELPRELLQETHR
ncbi:MAG: glycosyltransferase [Planctomycetes bacterium]|nr:glycosyltransferase [Planctomycetota bacterium]